MSEAREPDPAIEAGKAAAARILSAAKEAAASELAFLLEVGKRRAASAGAEFLKRLAARLDQRGQGGVQ